MAFELGAGLRPSAALLALAVLLDLLFGDPVYHWHPVRLIGTSLYLTERSLRRLGADGYTGGIMLFITLGVCWVGGISVVLAAIAERSLWVARALHLFLLYSLLALGDLMRHVARIEDSVRRGDLAGAHLAVSHLVGRDTAPMDGAACRRAAVESLAENLVDGFTSALVWYVVGGLPMLVLFKVVSTMDSMVGYKTPRYLQFGWCGARLDDVMNFVPARLTAVFIAAIASALPDCSGRKAVRIALAQHAWLPSPNSGWSEAAAAGALQRRLIGPIWRSGEMVTDIWVGERSDPTLATQADVRRAGARGCHRNRRRSGGMRNAAGQRISVNAVAVR